MQLNVSMDKVVLYVGAFLVGLALVSWLRAPNKEDVEESNPDTPPPSSSMPLIVLLLAAAAFGYYYYNKKLAKKGNVNRVVRQRSYFVPQNVFKAS